MGNTSLETKTALVTGGGSGIGRAIATQLVESGATVVVVDLNLDAATETVELIGPTRAVAAQADVRDPSQLENAVALAEQHWGRLDIVSSNAGLALTPTRVDLVPDEDFDRIFSVNVKGVWNTVRASIPALRRAGGGSIVITGSIMGERTRPGQAAYASSKAAANHLARSFALDLAADNIRVNAVAPVATDTAMLPTFLGPDDPVASKAAFIAGIPLGRLALPTDVAAATVFLASDAASFLTGVVLPVDGGRGI